MTPIKVRKKPVVVEAIQYHWWDDAAITWIRSLGGVVLIDDDGGNAPVVKLQTLEGLMDVAHGCWIIRGVHNEFYPIQAHVFADTYELAEEQYDDGQP